MCSSPAGPVDQTGLKWLRTLVIVLTVTMIVGFITIVSLFIVKFRSFGTTPDLSLPEGINLPDGQSASGFIHGNDLFYVVTRNDVILVYDASTNELIKQIEVR